MEEKIAPPLFARIMLGVSALVMVGVVYWFLSNAMASMPLPVIGPAKSAKSFNPKADVSKNPVFNKLDEKYLSGVPDLPTGRDNPFSPAIQNSTTSRVIPPEGLLVPGSSVKLVPTELPTLENSTSVDSAGFVESTSGMQATTTTDL